MYIIEFVKDVIARSSTPRVVQRRRRQAVQGVAAGS